MARVLFARWRRATVAALAEAREELDALNVFPVADSDTGTNVYLTVEAAQQAADEAEDGGAGLDQVARAYVDGALRGARGNSGVILSQLLRAAVPLFTEGDPGGGPVVAGALTTRVLRAGSDAAWAAVGRPVEGTILSVARAAAEGAEGAGDRATLPEVLRAAGRAAHEALARTPDQLDLLREAGVVDAGGKALVVVLDTTEHVLTGRVDPARRTGVRRALPVPTAGDGPGVDGPSYEVMYLLDADDAAVPLLRSALDPLGDSLVVVGGDGLWNVHVHVDDAGAAIEAGMAAGRPHRVVVTHLAEQARRAAHGDRPGRAVVTTAAGPGLHALFAAAGAVVVRPADGRRVRARELHEAALGCGADEVVIVPNDRFTLAAAEAVSHELRGHGVRVAVVPTRAQVQGLAALAVHDPARDFAADVVHMTASAGQTRDGAVTVARDRAMTTAGPCEVGDVLGVVDGDFAVVGDDLGEVAGRVCDRLIGGTGELLTIVTGAEAPDALAERVERRVRAARPEVDVARHQGGQPGYPLLLAVE